MQGTTAYLPGTKTQFEQIALATFGTVPAKPKAFADVAAYPATDSPAPIWLVGQFVVVTPTADVLQPTVAQLAAGLAGKTTKAPTDLAP